MGQLATYYVVVGSAVFVGAVWLQLSLMPRSANLWEYCWVAFSSSVLGALWLFALAFVLIAAMVALPFVALGCVLYAIVQARAAK